MQNRFLNNDNEKKGDMTMTLGDAAVGIFIRKVAPLGDPVEITVRGYELSVRKNDAQCVLVREA